MSYADASFVGLIWKPFLWGFLICLIFVIGRVIYSRQHPPEQGVLCLAIETIGLSLPLIALAFVAGDLTGISRSPVVGTVVPAVLTFVGALEVYAVLVAGDNHTRDNKAAIGYSVFLFALLFFYGVETGAYSREFGNEGRLKTMSEQEHRIRAFRQNLGLPPDPPSWLWSLQQ